jgi:two-component system response regulator YesN
LASEVGDVRPHTLKERRRLYLMARLIIERHYRRALTLEVVAKALATSPRQLQRAYAQFGESTFREDLVARRMAAACELLSQPAIPVRDVARLVGYRQPPHFAQAFRRRYGVSPARFRTELRQAKLRQRHELTAARAAIAGEDAGEPRAIAL